MTTINKYLLRESLIPFLLSLLTITLVLFLQFLIRSFDRFLGKGLDLTIIVEYLFLNLSWIIALSIPMSLLLSSVMTYGRMSEQNEITALKSAGVNFWSLIRPSLYFGALVGFLLCLFNNFLLPEMNFKARLLAKDIYQKKPELIIEPGYFFDMIPGYTMIASNIAENSFSEVKIFSKNNNEYQTTIYANNGNLISKDNLITINLFNGEMHEIGLKDYNHYRRIKFQKHQMVMTLENLMLDRNNSGTRSDREMTVPMMNTQIENYHFLINQSFERINQLQIDSENFIGDKNSLNSLIENLESNSNTNELINENSIILQLKNEKSLINNYEKNINQFGVEIHKKFSLAVACLLFVLVGSPLGIMIKKGGISIAAGLSIAFFLVYYILLIWGEQMADRSLMSPALGMWIPNIFLAISGWIIIKKSESN